MSFFDYDYDYEHEHDYDYPTERLQRKNIMIYRVPGDMRLLPLR